MGDKILVLLGRSYARPIIGLGDVIYDAERFFAKPKDFKLILFTGGEDVSPEFYGDSSPRNICWCTKARDVFEAEVYKLALEHKILMTGICRGMQFFNVMNGGKMMHHIDNHGGNIHLMQTIDGREMYVNSMHHQMIIPSKNTKIIGWSKKRLSKKYIGFDDQKVSYKGREYEAAIFTNTKCFGVQYHPECMDTETDGYIFFRDMVERALENDWDDFVNSYKRGNRSGEIQETEENNMYNSNSS